MPHPYRLDHIALLVRDLDETAAFLTGVLRIPEIPDPMGGGTVRWFEFGAGQRIHIQAGDISTTHVEKRTHFALTSADLDETIAYLRGHGIAFTDFKGTPDAINVRPDGMRAVFVQDPNGYWFELNDFRG